MSPELQEKIKIWQMKIADGTLTDEELLESVTHLRAQRNAVFQPTSIKAVKAPKAAKETAEPIDTKKMLSDLFGLKS